MTTLLKFLALLLVFILGYLSAVLSFRERVYLNLRTGFLKREVGIFPFYYDQIDDKRPFSVLYKKNIDVPNRYVFLHNRSFLSSQNTSNINQYIYMAQINMSIALANHPVVYEISEGFSEEYNLHMKNNSFIEALDYSESLLHKWEFRDLDIGSGNLVSD